ncbi:MAG TPA: leucyl aminopeptidase [Bacteroidetes bacterium]|nr:leucyl aminopeptidase [Bacteroidota bacterium]
MIIKSVRSAIRSISSEFIATFVFQDEKLFNQSSRVLTEAFDPSVNSAFASKDFSAKEGETLFVYTNSKKSSRLFIIGLGESKKLTIEKIRRVAATAAKKAKALKVGSAVFDISEIESISSFSSEELAVAISEASLLSLYKYDKYISKEKNGKKLTSITLCTTSKNIKSIQSGIHTGQVIAEATIHARNVTNAPGSEIYPETLAKETIRIGKKAGFSVTVFNRKKISQLGMGGVIGVSKGSEKEPRFITLEYGKQFKKHGTIALVGKGVTFDTGGISIKPSAGMAEMKMDMGGAAAVIGTFDAVSRLKLKRHIVGLIPSVENMPSGSAVKPGDIIRHYNGKTSEVDNTDAEGRLILADALSYAETFKPDVVIDLATLTGACVVALGHYASGMMGNDQQVMDALSTAGDKTYDRVWQLPLYDEYEKLIKSDVADVKNVGGRWAGAITAGWFLKKFIGDYKWVHLDIAGTVILEESQDYIPRGGSGAGVRLLVEFLKNWK